MKTVKMILGLALVVGFVVSSVSAPAWAARGTACEQLAPKILDRCPVGHSSCYGLCNAWAAPGTCVDPIIDNLCFGLSEECKQIYTKAETYIAEYELTCNPDTTKIIDELIYVYGTKCEVQGATILKETFELAKAACDPVCKEMYKGIEYSILEYSLKCDPYTFLEIEKKITDYNVKCLIGGDVLTTALLTAQANCLISPECKELQASFYKAINGGDCEKAGTYYLPQVYKMCPTLITELQAAFDAKCVVVSPCAEYQKMMDAYLVNKDCAAARELLLKMELPCPDLYPIYKDKLVQTCG